MIAGGLVELWVPVDKNLPVQSQRHDLDAQACRR
jgi:hypothetical protein